MEDFAFFTLDQLIQLGIVLVILAIVWAVVRAVLRLTLRIFAVGCGAILILGLLLLGVRYLL